MSESMYTDYSQFLKTAIIDEALATIDRQKLKQEAAERREAARLYREFEEGGASYTGNGYSHLVKGVLPNPDPCVYVLRVETGDPYIGQTIYPERRIIEHLVSPMSSSVTGFNPAVLVERMWTLAPCGRTSSESQDEFALAVERLLHDTDLAGRARIFDRPDILGELCFREGLCSSPDFVTHSPEYVEAINDAYCLDEDWLEENLQPSHKKYPPFGKMVHNLVNEGSEHDVLGIDKGIAAALWRTWQAFKRDGATDVEPIKCLYMALAYCDCGDCVYARHIIHTRLEDALYESHCRRHFKEGTVPSSRDEFFGRRERHRR